eukprot:4877222-Pyramimonas_sp.AAC.1
MPTSLRRWNAIASPSPTSSELHSSKNGAADQGPCRNRARYLARPAMVKSPHVGAHLRISSLAAA